MLNLTSILCSEFYDHDFLQTCRCKTRELWGLFPEVRGKSIAGFRSCLNFSQKCGFRYMPISQTFLYLQEDKYHFLKVSLSFIWYAKNHRNRLNLSFWKTQIKNITNTHINRFISFQSRFFSWKFYFWLISH